MATSLVVAVAARAVATSLVVVRVVVTFLVVVVVVQAVATSLAVVALVVAMCLVVVARVVEGMMVEC